MFDALFGSSQTTSAYDTDDFQKDVLDASREKPVLVDFWAPWCGPCRILGPTLEKLAGEQQDRWTLAKVNTDVYPQHARRYGVQGIPSVKLFYGGQVVNEFVGAMPEPMIRRWLEDALPAARPAEH